MMKTILFVCLAIFCGLLVELLVRDWFNAINASKVD